MKDWNLETPAVVAAPDMLLVCFLTNPKEGLTDRKEDI